MMDRKKIMARSIPGLLLCTIFFTAAIHADKVFTFNPPDGKKGSVTITTTTRRQLDDNQPVVDVVEKKWDITFRKKEDHFIQTWKPVSVQTSRDGREFVHPVHTVLHQFPVTYTIDLQGNILSVEGLAGVQDAMEGKVPERAWHSLAPLISEDMLAGIEKKDWKVLVEDCLGKPAKKGISWHHMETQGMAKREGRPYFRYVRVKQPIHYAGRDLLMLEEFRYTGLEALEKVSTGKKDMFTGEEIEEVRAWQGEEGIRIEVEGRGSRVLDPDTMLIYFASLTQKEHKTFKNSEGKESVLKIEETREYRFTYQ